jgi:hypothetical protein
MMRKILIMTLVAFMFLFSSCSSESEGENGKEASIEEKFVAITGSYIAPASMSNPNTLIWESPNLQGEYVEVVIQGKVLDFEIVALSWRDEPFEIIETDVLYFEDEIADSTLVLLTYQTETIPLERIKWKDETGNHFEYTISDYSVSDVSEDEENAENAENDNPGGCDTFIFKLGE